MRTPITETFEIDLPIFAFSHCRDVVAAVTKAGGMGVLGAAWLTPDDLQINIDWIRRQVDGKPFGVDLVFPGTHGDEKEPQEYVEAIPPGHLDFVKKMLDEAGLQDISAADR